MAHQRTADGNGTRRGVAGFVLLVAGAAVLTAAHWVGSGVASPGAAEVRTAPTALRSGGTLKISSVGSSFVDSIDPSIAYSTDSWAIEYSTGLKLLNYPEAPAPRGVRLAPEGATRYTVSRDGRTYTFSIRPGQRFSDGRPVTARNFAYAINRSLDKDLQSPASQFITDANGTNIVGAAAVRAGKAASATGVKARGLKLVIRLKRRDGTFLAKISMPFFQAISTRLARSKRVLDVDRRTDLPSAGPYYVAAHEPGRILTLKRNPYYRGPRPRRLDTIVGFPVGVAEHSHQQVLRGEADLGAIPPTATAGLGRRYGVNTRNTGRFHVRPTSCVLYWALNNQHPLFRNNARLRRAVNFAIDRKARAALGGAYTGIPSDQILPINFPGFRDANIYPDRANVPLARRLARGATRGGRAPYWYVPTWPTEQAGMELFRSAMQRIGIKIEPKPFAGYDMFAAAGRRGSRHAVVSAGWCQDYPDPYAFVNVLLYGGSIQAENNSNIAYFNQPAYNRRMERAARLIGEARMKTYGQLEIDITREQAPWAVIGMPTARFFLGARIDPRSFLYHPIYQMAPLNVLALKRGR